LSDIYKKENTEEKGRGEITQGKRKDQFRRETKNESDGAKESKNKKKKKKKKKKKHAGITCF